MKDLVSHQLVKYLEERGIEHIFGLCGHTNIAVLSALEKSTIAFVNVRHEQIASHAADGYARVTGKASVVLSHLGPGLSNAATGVANAALDCIPMVVIAGDIPSHYYGKHPHQEVNLHADGSQFEIYRPFVKRSWRVDRPDLFPEIIEKARFALISRPVDRDEKADKALDTVSNGILSELTPQLQNASWDRDALEGVVASVAEAHDTKLGKLAGPLRAALAGRAVSPSVFDMMLVLGRDETIARLKDASA